VFIIYNVELVLIPLCVVYRCPNANIPSKADRSMPYLQQWTGIYLKDAQARLQEQIVGFDLTIEDTYVLQQMCAYEAGRFTTLEYPLKLY
jgi:hypothetical protein